MIGNGYVGHNASHDTRESSGTRSAASADRHEGCRRIAGTPGGHRDAGHRIRGDGRRAGRRPAVGHERNQRRSRSGEIASSGVGYGDARHSATGVEVGGRSRTTSS